AVDGDTGADPMPVAGVPGDVDAEDPVPSGDDQQGGRVRADVLAARGAGALDGEVVVPRRLVVDDGDDARRVGAEGVLGAGVGISAGRQRADVGRRAVG